MVWIHIQTELYVLVCIECPSKYWYGTNYMLEYLYHANIYGALYITNIDVTQQQIRKVTPKLDKFME